MAIRRSSKIAALFVCLILVGGQLVSATQVDTSECSCHKPTPKPRPKPKPTPSPSTPSPSGASGKCPRDALKLSVCADLLGLANVIVGSPATKPCCSLLQGLVDLDAAVCLCTAIKANVLGLNLNIPVSLSLLLNACGRVNPSKFKCA